MTQELGQFGFVGMGWDWTACDVGVGGIGSPEDRSSAVVLAGSGARSAVGHLAVLSHQTVPLDRPAGLIV